MDDAMPAFPVLGGLQILKIDVPTIARICPLNCGLAEIDPEVEHPIVIEVRCELVDIVHDILENTNIVLLPPAPRCLTGVRDVAHEKEVVVAFSWLLLDVTHPEATLVDVFPQADVVDTAYGVVHSGYLAACARVVALRYTLFFH